MKPKKRARPNECIGLIILVTYNHKIYQIITCIHFTEVSNCIFWISLKDLFPVKLERVIY